MFSHYKMFCIQPRQNFITHHFHLHCVPPAFLKLKRTLAKDCWEIRHTLIIGCLDSKPIMTNVHTKVIVPTAASHQPDFFSTTKQKVKTYHHIFIFRFLNKDTLVLPRQIISHQYASTRFPPFQEMPRIPILTFSKCLSLKSRSRIRQDR